MAGTQHKAIVVFTTFTIVFLPLSFFTSYFGMNVQGIINTNRTEADFWKLCGSVSVCIILIISLYAFRQRIRQTMHRNGLSRDPFAAGYTTQI